ncbi:MAG TPA: Clp protease N-terminal domain-containing protein [Vicinamibacterales bacterium]|nr:Clp protease N-terminal domain-containing protein [Vicinamibacterales bacterium]
MFERYNESARRVLFFARFEVSKVGGVSIETEHLLKGVIREPRGVTKRVLSTPPLSIEGIRHALDRRITSKEPTSTSVEIPFSSAAKHVLQLAVQEAEAFGHRFIGPEHLLLGLMREEKSVAALVLAELGANIREVRQAVAQPAADPDSRDDIATSAIRDALAPIIAKVQSIAESENLDDRRNSARQAIEAIEAFAARYWGRHLP